MIQTLSRNNVKVTGKGTEVIVFAHGFGCNQTLWRSVAPAFEEDYKVILFDYVGSGRSDLSAYDKSKYGTLKGYAQDLLDVIHSQEVKNVVFVGHSVSGMIGILASIEEPDLFKELILVGPSARYLNDHPDYVGGFEKADIEGLFDVMDRNFIGWANFLAPMAMGNADNPEFAGELRDAFCSTDPVMARNFATATFYTDNRADLPKVTVPSLIMQCSEDVIAPLSAGEYLANHLPHSKFVVMEATGHCPQVSHPQETIDLIKNYLKR